MTKRILITGAHGFIGSNLTVRLGEIADTSVITFGRNDCIKKLRSMVEKVNLIIHLAGENRPADPSAFDQVNIELTRTICDIIRTTGRDIPLILTSSIHAETDNHYGKSKLAAEVVVKDYADKTKNSVAIYRLPGVFGKWCRPNYNSVVATFCYNVSRGLPIQISDPACKLKLVYIDDLIDDFLRLIGNFPSGITEQKVSQTYNITLGELANKIRSFDENRQDLKVDNVGFGLVRALYATYVSYLPVEEFTYELPKYCDIRGTFVEILKSPEAGQFSFFTIKPGITRGSHYHHSKTEKFLVVKGMARFRFRHLITNENHEVIISGEQSTIVDTVPGWVHDITNIGDSEAYVMLWANETFNRDRPDTVAQEV